LTNAAYIYKFGGCDAGWLSTIWFEVVENTPDQTRVFKAEFDYPTMSGIDVTLWVSQFVDADELVELYLEEGDFEYQVDQKPLVHKNSGKKWYPGFKVKRTGNKIVFTCDNITYSQAKKKGLLF